MAARSQAPNRARGFTDYLYKVIATKIFGSKGWPEWIGGILLGFINILFFAWALKPFTIYTGFLNWGQHIYAYIAGSNPLGSPRVHPLLERTSVGDIGLLLGAFLAAILAGEFRLRFPSSKLDYAEGALGGFLMALGVVLAVGCNWGGFFSAITALSAHGFFMFIGLLIGGLLGSLYVGWRTRAEFERLELEFSEESLESSVSEERKGGIPYTLIRISGLTLLVLVISAIVSYMLRAPDGGKFIGILLMGMAVGVVIQRSRFCFASAFRDILHGGGEFKRSVRLQIGIALGIMVGATGVFILKYMGYVSPEAYVKSAGWSNIVGGILFGLGMVIAGGCASGSLWRAAEGHVKLWVALAAAILSYAPLRYVIRTHAEWIYGPKISLVSTLGWAWGLIFVYLTMTAWILLVLYLDYRRGMAYG